eukprot:Gb_30473 [translate_table: standard]
MSFPLLQILAGNAKKVGSVRFEEIDGEDNKENTVTRVFPRVVKRRWEDGYDTDGQQDQSNQDKVTSVILTEKKELHEVAQAGPPNHYIVAESVDIVCETGTREVKMSEYTVIDPQDWDVDVVEDTSLQTVQTNDIDVTPPSSANTLNEESKQHEKQVEKRKKKRRKQSADATLDLEGQQIEDLEQRELK